ncbi:MAG: transglutaminase-like domain-containing protein [Planctomycetota bacterium]
MTRILPLSVAATGLLAACTSTGRAPSATTQATFAVQHSIRVPVPDGARRVRVWFPVPGDDEHQTVTDLDVQASTACRTVQDANGNRYVYAETTGADGDVRIRTSFRVTRREVLGDIDPAHTRPLTEAERRQHAASLASNQHVVVDDGIRTLAAQIAGDEQNPVLVARRLYDWTLDNVEYWVKDPSRWKASPVGSSEYCLSSRTGNCTDFHSLWTALARARGIPTRMKYGSLFKPSLDGVDQDASYHCWPESWFPGIGWVPNDVAVADIYRGSYALDASNRDKVVLTTAAGYRGPDERMVDYYFGNLDCRRVCWTEGRDLTLDPPQAGGPVNAVAKGYVEIDDAPFAAFERKMTYREIQ